MLSSTKISFIFCQFPCNFKKRTSFLLWLSLFPESAESEKLRRFRNKNETKLWFVFCSRVSMFPFLLLKFLLRSKLCHDQGRDGSVFWYFVRYFDGHFDCLFLGCCISQLLCLQMPAPPKLPKKTTHLFIGWCINNRWDFENDDGQKCDNAYYIEVMIGEQNCAFL